LIPFGDLRREYSVLSRELNKVIPNVLKSGWFILGKYVEEFEKAFADYIHKEVYAVGVGSGTEALHLALVASGVQPGDFVITVPNTAVPTVSAISFSGAKPLLVDIHPDTYNMDPIKLRKRVVKEKRRLGGKLKAIIPVHLYGQSADMEPIIEIAKEFELKVIEDACQAHGAEYKGKKVGWFGDYACFSFYPSKNLGAYGDGGMILTKNPEDAQKLKMLRNYGQEKRYVHKIKGFNSRQYIKNPRVIKPIEVPYGKHVFHLYIIRHPQRDRLQSYLKQNSVETAIHYPVPIHLQEAYKDLPYSPGDFPTTEKVSKGILSLPIFPYLRDQEVETVSNLINRFN